MFSGGGGGASDIRTTSGDLGTRLLAGRDFLFGELSLADVTAFPFLKYALVWDEGDGQRVAAMELAARWPAP